MTKVEVFITHLDDYGYYDGKDYLAHMFMNGQADGYILGIREMANHAGNMNLTILKDGKEV